MPRRGGPLAVVGHLSMYIQTETMSQSLIPTRGAACRREPLERARSNRRASRWTGSGRRHAGRVSQKRKPPLRAGRAGGGRVAHGGASSGVPGSQGMPQKRTSPGSFWKRYRRRPGERYFWAARACRGGVAAEEVVFHAFPSGEGGFWRKCLHLRRKTEEVLVAVQDKGEPGNGVFGRHGFRTRISPAPHHARRLAHSKGS